MRDQRGEGCWHLLQPLLIAILVNLIAAAVVVAGIWLVAQLVGGA